jgi:hypothetical protein
LPAIISSPIIDEIKHQRAADGVSAFGIIMTGRNVGVLIGPILLTEILRTSGSWALASPVFGTVTALALPSGVYLAFELAAGDRKSPK